MARSKSTVVVAAGAAPEGVASESESTVVVAVGVSRTRRWRWPRV
jgi:hypothetical protein